MALVPGTCFGAYDIVELLGNGGMGEVYRAHDRNLNRDVAIKVLLPAVANEPERLARFSREAQILAALNHPNIAHIYGLEDSGGVRALAMELVEGPTLAQSIGHGAIPLQEALPIAKQIADALEAAHEQGIIHRDLKPANIKVRPDGTVKVLDFGLAKATDPTPFASGDQSNSPTITTPARTEFGIILGTAAYMSPEQARGKPVDKRADIWSFGVVLYEMLTGQPPFRGETVTDLLAAVVREDPDLQRLPVRVRRLVGHCLEKDPKKRLREIGDAMLLLEDSASEVTSSKPMGWRAWAAACVLLAGVATWGVLRTPPIQPKPVSRWIETFAESFPPNGGMALSRDGTLLVYTVAEGGSSRIAVRSLDQGDAKPIPGTEGGSRPFFSPDGRWIGYFTGTNTGSLKKVAATGGNSTTLCEEARFYGGSWGEDDRIVFSGPKGLMRVSASDGRCENLTTADLQNGEAHGWPQTLPGGQILFSIGRPGAYDSARIALLDARSGRYRIVASGGMRPRYVPSGHLVYVRGGTMFAVPFDLRTLAVVGPETPVTEGVYFRATGGFANYTFSDSGLLLFFAAVPGETLRTLEWLDRKGAKQEVPVRRQDYQALRLAPDGRRAAVVVRRADANTDIWVLDLSRNTLVPLASEAINDGPEWAPDGQRMAFRSTRNFAINWMSADGSSKPQILLQESGALPASWTPDGKTLLYTDGVPRRVWVLPVSGTGRSPLAQEAGQRVAVFEATKANVREAKLSPDGKWLAYLSDESGRDEVYVRAFPGPGGKSAVSVNGGESPRWAHDGRELFYRDPVGNQLMVVAVATTPVFRAAQSKPLFGLRSSTWDVTPDGQRFLVVESPETAANSPKLHVVVNWFEELRRKAPVGKD